MCIGLGLRMLVGIWDGFGALWRGLWRIFRDMGRLLLRMLMGVGGPDGVLGLGGRGMVEVGEE